MVIAALAFLITAVVTGAIRTVLIRHGVMDLPNARSLHSVPVPRGGGVGIVVVFLSALIWMFRNHLVSAGLPLALVGGGLAIGIVGFIDDRFNLAQWPRVLVHCLAAAWAIWCLNLTHPFEGGSAMLGIWVGRLAAFVGLVWLTNLFNFMDGIDGITPSETVTIGLGVALIALIAADHESGGVPLGLSIAAASLGFLVWNWQPAKLFLGDVGSIPLGFLLGWLLLGLAGTGAWAPALILPLYYLVDSSLTLLHRLVRLRRVWEAHREHFYQRAVQRGSSHGNVVLRIAAANVLLVLLSLLATDWPFLSVTLAVVVVVALLVWLLRGPDPEAVQP